MEFPDGVANVAAAGSGAAQLREGPSEIAQQETHLLDREWFQEQTHAGQRVGQARQSGHGR
ncbi:MAG: hypothetical protein WDO24_29270 [Pseudomonadota bacterium]